MNPIERELILGILQGSMFFAMPALTIVILCQFKFFKNIMNRMLRRLSNDWSKRTRKNN